MCIYSIVGRNRIEQPYPFTVVMVLMFYAGIFAHALI